MMVGYKTRIKRSFKNRLPLTFTSAFKSFVTWYAIILSFSFHHIFLAFPGGSGRTGLVADFVLLCPFWTCSDFCVVVRCVVVCFVPADDFD